MPPNQGIPGIVFSVRENQSKMRDFFEKQENFNFLIVSFQSNSFLHTQP